MGARGPLRYIAGVSTLDYDRDACIGCGMCTAVCPHGVFEIADGDGRARVVDRDLCIECGACALNCRPNAITVDAGVGCAAAVIYGWLSGGEPDCGCS